MKPGEQKAASLLEKKSKYLVSHWRCIGVNCIVSWVACNRGDLGMLTLSNADWFIVHELEWYQQDIVVIILNIALLPKMTNNRETRGGLPDLNLSGVHSIQQLRI